LAGGRPDDLAALVVGSIVERTPDLDPSQVDEIVLGNANGAGEDNRNVAQMAGLLAGLPTSVPATTVNRLCGSSLDATIIASRQIALGEADIVLVGGVESMSRPLGAPETRATVSGRGPHSGLHHLGMETDQLRHARRVDRVPGRGDRTAT